MADPGAIRAGKAAVEISGDDTKLKEATQRSTKYLKDLGKASQEASGASSGGFLENLARRAKAARKEERASGATALEHALASGGGMTQLAGQVMGIGMPLMATEMVGKGFKDVTDKILEMRQQLKEGKITQEELIRNLATGIPILGEFVAGFLNIRELLTGEKAQIEAIKKEAERTAVIFDAQAKAAEKLRTILAEIKLLTAKTNLATQAVGKDAYTQRMLALQSQQVELDEKRKTAGKKEAEDYKAQAEPGLKAMSEDAEKIGRQIEDMDPDLDPEATKKKVAEYEEAQRRYQQARGKMEAKRGEILKQAQEPLNAEQTKIDAERQQVIKEYQEAWGEAGRQASLALDRALASGAAARLRTRGKEYEAEVLQLRTALAEQIGAIEHHAKEEMKQFGITDPNDPRAQVIQGRANQQIAAATEDTSAKEADAQQREYARKRQQALTLRQLQIEAIDDRRVREAQAMDASYQAEVDVAERAGRETFEIYQRWQQARANLDKQHARERLEQEKEEAQRLLELQIEGMDNRNQRELAALDAKYRAEYEKAQRNPSERDPKAVYAQWAAARANLLRQQTLQVTDATHEMDVEIERAQNALSKRGLAARLADLEIERRERLRQEADPRTTTGIGKDKINALYDLKRQQELLGTRSAAGSFSARELSRMSGSSPLDAIKKHTKETAANTRKALDQKPAFSPG